MDVCIYLITKLIFLLFIFAPVTYFIVEHNRNYSFIVILWTTSVCTMHICQMHDWRIIYSLKCKFCVFFFSLIVWNLGWSKTTNQVVESKLRRKNYFNDLGECKLNRSIEKKSLNRNDDYYVCGDNSIEKSKVEQCF